MEPAKKRGRPPKPAEEKMVRVTMFLLPRQSAKVDAYGSDWLRKLIDKGKPPKV